MIIDYLNKNGLSYLVGKLFSVFLQSDEAISDYEIDNMCGSIEIAVCGNAVCGNVTCGGDLIYDV